MDETQPSAAQPDRSAAPSSSIFLEILNVFKKSCWKVLPLVLIFALLTGGIQYIESTFLPEFPTPVTKFCNEAENKKKCREDNKKIIQNEIKAYWNNTKNTLGEEILYIILVYTAASLGSYFATRRYLLGTNASLPPASEKQALRYVLLILWRVFRPILWNLIPIFGQIMYIRALTRWDMVGVLILKGDKTPFETSWKLSEGNVWRILGAEATFYVTIYGLISGLVFLLTLLITIIFVRNAGTPIQGLDVSSNKNLIEAIGFVFTQFLSLWVLSSTPVGVYRVLGQGDNSTDQTSKTA